MQDKENGDPEPEDPEDPKDSEEVECTAKDSETSESDEDDLIVVEQPKSGNKQTRSVSTMVDALRGYYAIAKIWVTDFTLFFKYCLKVREVKILVHQACSHAENKQKLYA